MRRLAHSEKGGACNLASRNTPAQLLEELSTKSLTSSSFQLHTSLHNMERSNTPAFDSIDGIPNPPSMA
jgi:hypothetical protein